MKKRKIILALAASLLLSGCTLSVEDLESIDPNNVSYPDPNSGFVPSSSSDESHESGSSEVVRIESIQVKNAKKEFVTGETFSFGNTLPVQGNEAVLIVYYTDRTSNTVNDVNLISFSMNGVDDLKGHIFDQNDIGKNVVVTVRYENVKTTYTINISAASMVSITVSNYNSLFAIGDTFSFGGKVKAYYGDGTAKVISSGYQCYLLDGNERIDADGYVFGENEAGTTRLVIVTYEGFETTYEIEIDEKPKYVNSIKVTVVSNQLYVGEETTYTVVFGPENIENKEYSVSYASGLSSGLSVNKDTLTITALEVGSYSLLFTAEAPTSSGRSMTSIVSITVLEDEKEKTDGGTSSGTTITIPDYDDGIIFSGATGDSPQGNNMFANSSSGEETFIAETLNELDIPLVYKGVKAAEHKEESTTQSWAVLEPGGYIYNTEPLKDFQTWLFYCLPSQDNLLDYNSGFEDGIAFSYGLDSSDNYEYTEDYPCISGMFGPNFADLTELPDYFRIENNGKHPIEILAMGTLTAKV